jgi:hypothetical protein
MVGRTPKPHQNPTRQAQAPAPSSSANCRSKTIKPARCSGGARAPARSSASSPPPAAAAPSTPRVRTYQIILFSRRPRWRRRSPSPYRRTGGRGVTRTTGCAIPPTRTSRPSSPQRTPMPTPSSARPPASARASPPRCAPGCPLPLPHHLSPGALGS